MANTEQQRERWISGGLRGAEGLKQRINDSIAKHGENYVFAQARCKHCTALFWRKGANSRYCKACAPTHKARHRIMKFGITDVQHQAMWDKQKGLCPLCDKDLSTLPSKKVHIDHDHSTGRVRGILCNGCNLRLGTVENHVFMTRYVSYLQT